MCRNSEALFALEFIKNIKDQLYVESYDLKKMIDIAVDMIYDKPIEVKGLLSDSEIEQYQEMQREE